MSKRLGLFGKLCEKHLPFYWNFWPDYWLAIWSGPDLRHQETHWQALRVTLRSGKYHSEIRRVIKSGIV